MKQLTRLLFRKALVPVAAFPTQLKQAIAAINHVQSLGVKPQNIQLVGDSAGGNLILQVLAHLLHPLKYENVPFLSLSAPLKGAYLMSPWVDLADIRGTLKRGDPTDMMTSSTLRYWGVQSLKPVPKEYLGYIEANSARDDWWKGVDVFIDRVLITAGREECLKDEILRFSSVFEKFHSHVNMQEHDGIHDDPLFAVDIGESAGGATDMIIDWLQAGF
jgi:acetyl esterase/lipase